MPFQSTTPTGDIPTTLDSMQSSLYEDGTGSVDEYDFQPGVAILPIAEDPPEEINALKAWSPVVILRLHAPYRIRKATTQGRKTNTPPIVPAPTDSGKFIFIGGSLTVSNSLNQSLVTYDWSVGTEYVYVENCVSRIEDGFVLSGPSWIWASTVDNRKFGEGKNINLGAISAAGIDAKEGYFLALDAVGYINSLGVPNWSYNSPTFYPGVLMNSEIANGGLLNLPNLLPPRQ